MKWLQLSVWALAFAVLAAARETVPSLICEGQCTPGVGSPQGAVPLVPTGLAPKAYDPLPLGSIAPAGWLLGQLLRQANSLSGYMAKSTFPGADHVNTSAWVGGDGKKAGGTDQWCESHAPVLTLSPMAVAKYHFESLFAFPLL